MQKTDAAAGAAKLATKDLCVQYAQDQQTTEVLKGINLTVKDGEFVSIVGPSGCGKSTLLKAMIGLVPIASGTVETDGQIVKGIANEVGLVFQQDALLPWKTVIDNIRLPLDIKGIKKSEQREQSLRLIKKVGLTGFENYRISQLSGGMRKRVALARAFAYDPDIYFMDEPFASLDAQTRVNIGEEFLYIWENLGKSVVFVTHDIEEAIAMSDRVIVMSPRPSTILEEFTVDLPRPRSFYLSRFERKFKELQMRIWQSLSSAEAGNI